MRAELVAWADRRIEGEGADADGFVVTLAAGEVLMIADAYSLDDGYLRKLGLRADDRQRLEGVSLGVEQAQLVVLRGEAASAEVLLPVRVRGEGGVLFVRDGDSLCVTEVDSGYGPVIGLCE